MASRSMKTLSAILVAVISAPFVAAAVGEGADDSWSVGDCIIADFSANFTIFLDKHGWQNNSEVIRIPAGAKVDPDQSTCGNPGEKNPDQLLVVKWTDKQKNDSSIDLNRKIAITFRRNLTES